MGRMTQRLKLTVKKTLHQWKDTERVQKAGGRVLGKNSLHSIQDLIFVDEAGVNLTLIRLYARAGSGQRAGDSSPKRGKWFPDCGNCFKRDSGINQSSRSNRWINFWSLCHRLVPHLWSLLWYGITALFIKHKRLRKAIRKAGAKLINLPPYSPFFQLKFFGRKSEHSSSIGAKPIEALDSNRQCITSL